MAMRIKSNHVLLHKSEVSIFLRFCISLSLLFLAGLSVARENYTKKVYLKTTADGNSHILSFAVDDVGRSILLFSDGKVNIFWPNGKLAIEFRTPKLDPVSQYNVLNGNENIHVYPTASAGVTAFEYSYNGKLLRKYFLRGVAVKNVEISNSRLIDSENQIDLESGQKNELNEKKGGHFGHFFEIRGRGGKIVTVKDSNGLECPRQIDGLYFNNIVATDRADNVFAFYATKMKWNEDRTELTWDRHIVKLNKKLEVVCVFPVSTLFVNAYTLRMFHMEVDGASGEIFIYEWIK